MGVTLGPFIFFGLQNDLIITFADEGKKLIELS